MGRPPRPVVLASIYMPIEDQIPPKELVELVIHCEDNDIDLIISVDSNAHHNLWGCKVNNKRGEQFVNYILTTNLTIINIGTEPTFVTSRYQTIIDITLASTRAADQVKNWRVSDEPSLSDHRRICYELDLMITPHVPRRNPRKTDRLKYKSLLTHQIGVNKPQDIDDIANIEENVNKLTKYIKTSYEQACPLKKNNIKQPSKNNWWGPDLERMRKKLRHLFNRAKNTKQEQDWDNYKEAQYQYNKCVREKEKASWHKFCTSIESNDTAARIRKILANDNTRTLGSLRKADGTYTKDDKEISETLIETHFPGCRIVDSTNWGSTLGHHPIEEDWDFANNIEGPTPFSQHFYNGENFN
ncbi:uncharacterized protein [Maniola hyperantus]|uniref:uncharacterized protein n=1 Tax=Aphantopus hyperantus TaxID=2795564 RepID=UPI00374A67BE